MKRLKLLRILPLLVLSPLVLGACNDGNGSENSQKPEEVIKQTSVITYSTNLKNGSIKFDGHELNEHVEVGSLIKVIATPAEGYLLDKLTVNGVDITSPMQFKVEEANTTYVVSATFKEERHFGTIKIDESCKNLVYLKYGIHENEEYELGTTVFVDVASSDDYKLIDLFVNGSSILYTKTFKIEEEIEYIITAEFKAIDKRAKILLESEPLNGQVKIVGGEFGEYYDIGTTIYFTIIPETGYQLDKLIINGDDITADQWWNIPEIPEQTYYVNATFKEIPAIKAYSTIQADDCMNGAIGFVNYQSGDKVEVGTTVKVVAQPQDGYKLEGVYVNNLYDITKSMEYKITEKNKNYLFSASFVKIPDSDIAKFTINPTNNGFAYVSMQGKTGESPLNKEVDFVIDPDEGYELESFKVDGVDITRTLSFTPTIAKNYSVDVKFRPRQNKTSGTEVVDGVTYTYQSEYQKELIYDEKYIGEKVTYTQSEKENFYGSNYKVASTYNEAISRTENNLISGDKNIPQHIANFRDIKNPTNETGTKYFNARQRYIVDSANNVIGYIINDLDNNDANDTVIFKGAAYVSMDEVSAYFYAFNEIPANWNPDKNGGKDDVVAQWGQFGRVNNGPFGSNLSRYPYQPILEGQGTTFKYREADFGTDGNFLFYSKNGQPNTKQKPYNNGESIERGTCRMLYTDVKGNNSTINPGEERHVYYTWSHYNSFEEYLNYKGGYNYMCGNIISGNKYNGKKGDLKNRVVQPIPYNLVTW